MSNQKKSIYEKKIPHILVICCTT